MFNPFQEIGQLLATKKGSEMTEEEAHRVAAAIYIMSASPYADLPLGESLELAAEDFEQAQVGDVAAS